MPIIMFAMQATRSLLTALLAMGLTFSGPARSESDKPLRIAQNSSQTVWCHDAKRSLVRKTSRLSCKGSVVSADEAARIKQDRVLRIKRMLERERNPVVPDKRLGGSGTGFFISTQGHVLTNNHVVDECGALTVTRPAGDEIVARLIHRDPRHDLALLQTGHSVAHPARFRSDEDVALGEAVTVVGYPSHGKVVVKPILVDGHVQESEIAQHPQVFAMKIDVRPGNSGGPILDQAGRVVGVVFAKIDTPKVYSKSGKLIRDLGIGMRLPVVRSFLRGQPANMTMAVADEKLNRTALLQAAREFVAQIGCWK
jgi:serine protease Do